MFIRISCFRADFCLEIVFCTLGGLIGLIGIRFLYPTKVLLFLKRLIGKAIDIPEDNRSLISCVTFLPIKLSVGSTVSSIKEKEEVYRWTSTIRPKPTGSPWGVKKAKTSPTFTPAKEPTSI